MEMKAGRTKVLPGFGHFDDDFGHACKMLSGENVLNNVETFYINQRQWCSRWTAI